MALSKIYNANHSEAVDYYNRPIEYRKKQNINPDSYLANLNKLIGQSYIFIDQHDKAIEYLELAKNSYTSIYGIDNSANANIDEYLGMAFEKKGITIKVLQVMIELMFFIRKSMDHSILAQRVQKIKSPKLCRN